MLADNPLIASVIVPVYNKVDYLEGCVGALDRQSMDHDLMEAIFIDDGSSDGSPEVLGELSATRPWMRVITQENGGVCAARNAGIRAARGKYLFYLDPDDSFSSNTLADVSSFFDLHYDEVDLVTYLIVPIRKGKERPLHYRFEYLTETGVYDLTEGDNCFVCQTTMNVCVKNLFEDNSTFDFESLNGVVYHEDQEYITNILLDKLKIGYVSTARYEWMVNDASTTSTIVKPLFIFENTMLMYDKLFSRYEGEAPRYLQAMLLHDMNWKMRSNVLAPYHYQGGQYDDAVRRLEELASRIDVDVLASHPTLGPFRMAFLLKHRHDIKTECVVEGGGLSLHSDGREVYSADAIEFIVLRSIATGGRLRLVGFLKDPCFLFLGKPELIAHETSGESCSDTSVPLRFSSWSYHQSTMLTCKFWGFEYVFDASACDSVRFSVRCGGVDLDVRYTFMQRAIFSEEKPRRMRFTSGGFSYRFESGIISAREIGMIWAAASAVISDVFCSKGPKMTAVKRRVRSMKASGRRIWLYHDCHGVEKNNAYDQYIHDIQMDDGIERYYVVNDPIESKRHLFTDEQMEKVIRFGEWNHRILFLAAEMVITAYIENKNWMPFSINTMKYYWDVFTSQVVYLQHGVLHAHMPWKYSLDRLLLDKEVVSTSFEVDNLKLRYGFDDDHLITAGAPRYDFIDTASTPMRKILLAPSWRGYLVEMGEGGAWKPRRKALSGSIFYRELSSFLRSPALARLLEEYDYTLELKLHPIMAEAYGGLFDSPCPRVSAAASSVDEAEYAVLITDFSSYRFDFVYLKRALMYFLPDEEEYRTGMCAFRETDLPLEGQFGDMARTAEEALALLESILSDDARSRPEHDAQMDGFFLHYDDKQRDRIYQALV